MNLVTYKVFNNLIEYATGKQVMIELPWFNADCKQLRLTTMLEF